MKFTRYLLAILLAFVLGTAATVGVYALQQALGAGDPHGPGMGGE